MNKLIVCNWKMNGSIDLLKEFKSKAPDIINNTVMALPSLLIGYCANSNMILAAQDCSIYKGTGAHTGEISASMLANIGCKYILIGHSERRSTGDTSDVVLQKLKNAIEANIIPIICVDETYTAQLCNETKNIINNNNAIIAYEPVSAIGTGVIPSLQEIDNALGKIKTLFKKEIKVLYGGSVKSSNCESILNLKNVDGVLIGGASLKIDEMNKITQINKNINLK